MRIPRLVLLTALPAALVLSTTTAPTNAAPAAPAKAKHLLASTVTASEKAVDDGTQVKVSFRVNNRTGKAVPSSTAKAFLVDADGRSTGLATVAVPRMPAGKAQVVRGTAVTDAAPGDYSVRVCLVPRPGGSCSTSAPTVTIEAPATVELRLTPTSYDYGDVVAGEEAQGGFVLHNDGATDQMLVGQGGDFADGTAYYFDHDGPFTCATGLVPAHGSCTITVAFAPQTTGVLTDVMRIYGPDDLLLTADLTGVGTGAPTATAPQVRHSSWW